MIRRNWIENIKALIRQKSKPVTTMIEDYEAGKPLDELKNDNDLVAYLRSHGTRIEAAIKYLKDNHKPTLKKPARKKRKADNEVT